MTRRHVAAWTSGALAAVLLVTTQSGISTASSLPSASPLPTAADAAPAALQGKTFTLVTGDVVTVEGSGSGARVDTEPAPGRERVGFLQTRTGDDISVVPTDVAPLVASGQVDEQLFNLSALERLGLDDAAGNRALPLIIRHSGQRLPAATRAEAVQQETVPLESIDSTAVTVPERDKGELWKTLTAPAGSAEGGLRPAIETVWLDTPVELTDAQVAADPPETTPQGDVTVSDLVGQINADGVRDQGLDGTGVRVAVIDTGVRATHPDLADRVSKSANFIGSDNETGDIDGHGTHVAGIIAGTGAASNGKYTGVAPGAEILSGRVLSGPLGGSISDVIDGMEWAADEGVDIVNMSLGSSARTDGTDPWSLATDALLERGVLPVVSAGNSGPGSFSVSPPAAAEGALAVGAAGGDDAIASFSSRGPLFGDYNVKPNVKAPGVAVTAARAKGTSIGDADPAGPVGPVDDNYTRLSGTSMAAPAVTGAAALVMQAHPDWTPQQVTRALTSSARPSPGETVYDQGAGLIDVQRAIDQPVQATLSTIDFGRLTWPRTDDNRRKVAFTNDSDQEVALDLSLDVTSTRGDLPAALLGLAENRLTVPAHGTASAVVEFRDTGVRTGGTLSALLTAKSAAGSGDGATTVQVPVGLTLEPESYGLTLNLRDQLGDPAHGISIVDVMPLDRGLEPFEGMHQVTVGSSIELRVPAGAYGVSALVGRHTGPDTYWYDSDIIAAGEPLVQVDKDTTMTLGGTAAVKLGHTVDNDKVERIHQAIGILQKQKTTPAGLDSPLSVDTTVSFNHLPPVYWAVPSTTRSEATYTTYYREDLAEGYRTGDIPDGAPSDGYDYPTASGPIYYLGAIHEGGIPADLTPRVRDSQLARTEAHYGSAEQTGTADRYFPLRSKLATATLKGIPLGGRRVNVPSPSTRTEFYTASKDITWTQELRRYWQNADGTGSVANGALFTEPRAYRPGPRTEYWNYPVSTVALSPDGRQFTRTGDTVTVDLPLGGDTDRRHLFRTEDFSADYSYALSRDGKEIAKSRNGATESPRNTALAAWTVPADTGTYTLRARASRLTWDGKPKWSTAPELDAVWTFRSGRVAEGGTAALPLTTVRFTPPVDEWSRAEHNQVVAVPFDIQRTGDQARGRLRALTVEASFDGGTTWETVPVVRNRALITHPDLATLPAGQLDRNGHGYVSLRVKGTDRVSSFEVTVKKAYKLKQS
ncbi:MULTISPECIES: S8 family peptidase [Streptomyces]|uniref:S8 family serine peptidase n=2 Tax=Streptomyces TaxID=1883 RepID=A0ABV9ISB8_9ACTN